jgi:pseudomonalisin
VLKRLCFACFVVSIYSWAFGQSVAIDRQGTVYSSFDSSIKIPGHLPRFVGTSEDLGPLAAEAPLNNLELLLKRTPEQEEALQVLIREQQDPSSGAYKKWLSPEEFGRQFGATDDQISAISDWLNSYGLRVKVSHSRSFIDVEGNAAQISATFHTELHSFNVEGHTLYSVVQDPSVPAQFSKVIQSISGLSQATEGPGFRDTAEAAVMGSAHPNETLTSGNHIIAPADFAILFDINRAYNSGYNGSGQTIAIVGRSRVSNADIENFAVYTSLTLKDPIVTIPPGGVDPGQTNDPDQREATLDVERASSVAPGATINLVINSASNGGIRLPLRYIIDDHIASIVTVSFGACELSEGQANTDFYSALFTQGAAEGITSFVSSDDSGAAGCDAHSVPAPVNQSLSINFYCASPNVTCVGGTTLNDFDNPGAYWSSSNSTGHASVLGYIPEGAFNAPITNANTLQVFASGGGVSAFVPKPAWQTGLNVPTDGYRDVPDIAFPSSSHDGYLMCYAFDGYPCVPNTQGVTLVTSGSGTSAASPSMAGIQALIDQEEGGALGNINPRLYALASSSQNKIFHDVTVESSGVANCTLATPSLCNNSTPGPTSLTGGLAGYLVGPGYDLVTGWGSLDVYNLLTNWNSGSSLALPTVNLALSQSLVSTAQSVNFSATVSGKGPLPTGTIQFEVNESAIGGPVALSAGGATSAPYMSGTLQVDKVVAIYSGDAYYAPATSTVSQFTVTSVGAPIFTVTTTPITIAAPGKSGSSTITVTPLNGFSGTVTLSCAGLGGFSAGTCSFAPASLNITGAPATATLTLAAATPSLRGRSNQTKSSTDARLRDSSTVFESALLISFLGVVGLGRKRRISLTFVLATLCAAVTVDIGCNRPTPTITVVSALNPGTTQEPITFSANVTGPASSSAPSGSVQFFSNGVSIGAAQSLANGQALLSQTFTTAGTFAITAQYLGSSSYGTVQSLPLSETITFKNQGAIPGTYTILVNATSGSLSQTVPVQVDLQ